MCLCVYVCVYVCVSERRASGLGERTERIARAGAERPRVEASRASVPTSVPALPPTSP